MSDHAHPPDEPEHVYTDLDDLAGAWVDVPGFDDAIDSQDRIDDAHFDHLPQIPRL